jgi:hypothetical protein
MALPIKIAAGLISRKAKTSASNVTFRKVTNNIDKRVAKLEKEFGNIAIEAHKKFVEVTPVNSGNAKSKTELRGKEIQANYDYSVRLQNGHSKQAPNGMRDQTIDHIKNIIKKI